jgi:hypothetical protein
MLDGADHLHAGTNTADPDFVTEHNHMSVRRVNFRRLREHTIRFLGYNHHYRDNFPSQWNTEDPGGIELVLK